MLERKIKLLTSKVYFSMSSYVVDIPISEDLNFSTRRLEARPHGTLCSDLRPLVLVALERAPV